jgi:hypothetical protein
MRVAGEQTPYDMIGKLDRTGRLHLTIAEPNAVPQVLESAVTGLNDNKLHVVYVTREGKSLTLNVDSEPEVEKELKSAGVGTDDRIKSASLVVGGVADEAKIDLVADEEGASVSNLSGCIVELVYNDNRIELVTGHGSAQTTNCYLN